MKKKNHVRRLYFPQNWVYRTGTGLYSSGEPMFRLNLRNKGRFMKLVNWNNLGRRRTKSSSSQICQKLARGEGTHRTKTGMLSQTSFIKFFHSWSKAFGPASWFRPSWRNCSPKHLLKGCRSATLRDTTSTWSQSRTKWQTMWTKILCWFWINFKIQLFRSIVKRNKNYTLK